LESFVVAVTGASGAVYGKTLVEALIDKGYFVELIFSEVGKKVFEYELETSVEAFLQGLKGNFVCYDEKDFFAPPSSGSHPFKGMVVVPCSTGTLGHIANGVVENLIHRVADVSLKEKRPLVLVVRETPLSQIHLENMLKLSKAGATILPASPSFYSKPKTVGELVNTVVERALRHLVGVPFNLSRNWG